MGRGAVAEQSTSMSTITIEHATERICGEGIVADSGSTVGEDEQGAAAVPVEVGVGGDEGEAWGVVVSLLQQEREEERGVLGPWTQPTAYLRGVPSREMGV